jgi:selenocysteine-specific elongation factor
MPDAATATPPPATEQVLNVNVGVLGHVDSGKTSLVKTLSTLLSTAALDKSKQSRERGELLLSMLLHKFVHLSHTLTLLQIQE